MFLKLKNDLALNLMKICSKFQFIVLYYIVFWNLVNTNFIV